MAKANTTPTTESPKMADLRQQLLEASTIEEQRQVMMNTMTALRTNEISATECKVLNKEFAKTNKEYRKRLKEELERFKEAQRAKV